MTESSTPTTESGDGAEVDATPPVVDAETPDAVTEGDSTDRKLANEAARYRLTARAAETRLAIAEARIADLQKDEVTRIFKERFVSADDAWLLPDVDLQAMLNEDGKVDEQLVHEVADNILDAKPHWRIRPRPLGAPASAVTGDGKAPGDGARSQPGWAELLKGKTAG